MRSVIVQDITSRKLAELGLRNENCTAVAGRGIPAEIAATQRAEAAAQLIASVHRS